MLDTLKNTSAFQHDKTRGHDEWLTPPDIIQALAPFDLDPCAPIVRPWDTATKHYTVLDNGLHKPWEGFVWCNPPYGKETGRWMKRMAEHNNGIALVFARTDTAAWQDSIFPYAATLFCIRGRLIFRKVDGSIPLDKNGNPQSAGAPSILIAYGSDAVSRIEKSKIRGSFITCYGGNNVTA